MTTLKFWDGTAWMTLGYPVGRNVLAAQPVLDVGVTGQIRAGRQLTVADFTAMGLAQPIGLWNLSDLTNLGSAGSALVNKGTVTFATGINGLTGTAAQFTGNTAQALYIVDTGSSDPYRIRTGSFGCWLRTAKRGTFQQPLGKAGINTSDAVAYFLQITDTGLAQARISGDGTASSYLSAWSISDVADDRWHFVVATYDGMLLRLYVDGAQEGVNSAGAGTPGSIYASSAKPFVIGGVNADSGTVATQPHYGRVDEAFITADVLSEDQIRNLYCVKTGHGLSGAPRTVALSVRRRRRGAAFVAADFPTQPLRLHNLSGGSGVWTGDLGSNNVVLTVPSGGVDASPVGGPDGLTSGAITVGSGGGAAATDTGLPAGTASRSYGCWFKTSVIANVCLLSWATITTADERLVVSSVGAILSQNGTDTITGPLTCDGQWHFVVVSEDNAAVDGVKRKLYFDGRFVAGSTVLNSITLAGANRFRIGANQDGSAPFTGMIARAFVCGYALTFEQIAALYAKGSQALALSPKNAGDHVEAIDGTNILATFDTLDSQHQVDLAVEA